MRRAKMDGVALKTSPQTHQFFLTKLKRYGKQYVAALQRVEANYARHKVGRDPPAYKNAVAQLEAIEGEVRDLKQEVHTAIVGVKASADATAQKAENVAKSQAALEAAGGDLDKLDPTSRRTMLDFADQYKLAYYVLWAKVFLAAGVLYMVFSLENVVLSLAITAAIAIVWYIINLLIALYRGRNPKGGSTEEGKMCGDGVTPMVGDGENCPDICTKDTYVACNQGSFAKCCWDGTPFDGESCPTVPEGSCYESQYGCCPDGKTARTATGGCPEVVACASSQFGCCPNGQPRTDATDESCTFQSPCGFTAFGCCENSTPKTDAAGSNCT
jgi:hypothetical protein